MLLRGRSLPLKAPAVTARAIPGVVAAGAAVAGLIAIDAGVWAISRPAGMMVMGLMLLGCAAGWYRGSSQ